MLGLNTPGVTYRHTNGETEGKPGIRTCSVNTSCVTYRHTNGETEGKPGIRTCSVNTSCVTYRHTNAETEGKLRAKDEINVPIALSAFRDKGEATIQY